MQKAALHDPWSPLLGKQGHKAIYSPDFSVEVSSTRTKGGLVILSPDPIIIIVTECPDY